MLARRTVFFLAIAGSLCFSACDGESAQNPNPTVQVDTSSTEPVADVAVLNLQEGSFGYADSFGGRLAGDKRLTCELTVKDGEVVWDWNGRTGVDYPELGDSYGIREGEYLIMPPA